MNGETKKCWKCGQPKSVPEDYCRDGKDSVCKQCRYELNSNWAKENREKLRPKRAEYMKRYRSRKAQEAKQQSPTNSLDKDGSVKSD